MNSDNNQDKQEPIKEINKDDDKKKVVCQFQQQHLNCPLHLLKQTSCTNWMNTFL